MTKKHKGAQGLLYLTGTWARHPIDTKRKSAQAENRQKLSPGTLADSSPSHAGASVMIAFLHRSLAPRPPGPAFPASHAAPLSNEVKRRLDMSSRMAGGAH